MSTSNNNEITITDKKFLAVWDLQAEEKITHLFKQIKAEKSFDSPKRKQLVKLYLEILDRKYEDKTPIDPKLEPSELGVAEDLVLNQGLRQIGLWATAQSFAIFDRILAGNGVRPALFGDSNLESEKARVNVITGIGFLDAFDNGWTISGGFPRSTTSFTVSETGTATSTSFLFDRSVFPVADRKVHIQNQDSFTITNMFVLTSI